MFWKVEINIPLLDAITQIPKYAKFLKELYIHKRKKMKGGVELEGVMSTLTKNEVVARSHKTLPKKRRDPRIFSVPCTIGEFTFVNAMLDLGASINVIPTSIYKSLNFCDLEPIGMTIQLANKSIVQPLGVLEDLVVQINELIFPTDFYVLDMEDKTSGKESTLILGRPFLMTARTKIDVHARTLLMEFGDNLEKKLLQVLRQHKKALGWRLLDLPRINPSICMHKILMKEEACPIRKQQKRMNLTILDVVKKEVMKLLAAGIIYPISDSQWVSPIKINHVTRKDHFPLPFIDQVLEKLVGKSHYCFLDGFSIYMQIHIAPEDQHKTTFTCPFGTFAYTCMLFGLCNAPSTFQCCMTNIFSDLLQDCMEVFMDDFIVYTTSFDACLENLSRVLTRYINTNLVVNFEKCHFMVIEGIVLGHLVSNRGIEVDKSKIDIITSLPNPAFVWEVRSFLGHVGFYRRCIKNLSKITLPLSKLLQKDEDFNFD
ncbi:Retrovirus-related Pol polyprotein from transposon 17.6, partial [Mucuna pruriens]